MNKHFLFVGEERSLTAIKMGCQQFKKIYVKLRKHN